MEWVHHLDNVSTYDQVNEGKEEEEDHEADRYVSLASSQTCLVETFFFYWYITSLKVAVVLLVDAASFYSLLSHGLLHRPIAAFLKGTTLCDACKNTRS